MDKRNQSPNLTFGNTRAETLRKLGVRGFNTVHVAGFEYFLSIYCSAPVVASSKASFAFHCTQWVVDHVTKELLPWRPEDVLRLRLPSFPTGIASGSGSEQSADASVLGTEAAPMALD